jgi:hypothetical protein
MLEANVGDIPCWYHAFVLQVQPVRACWPFRGDRTGLCGPVDGRYGVYGSGPIFEKLGNSGVEILEWGSVVVDDRRGSFWPSNSGDQLAEAHRMIFVPPAREVPVFKAYIPMFASIGEAAYRTFDGYTTSFFIFTIYHIANVILMKNVCYIHRCFQTCSDLIRWMCDGDTP